MRKAPSSDRRIVQLFVLGLALHLAGLFFNGMREAQANPQAYDAAARKRLHALSRKLTGLATT